VGELVGDDVGCLLGAHVEGLFVCGANVKGDKVLGPQVIGEVVG